MARQMPSMVPRERQIMMMPRKVSARQMPSMVPRESRESSREREMGTGWNGGALVGGALTSAEKERRKQRRENRTSKEKKASKLKGQIKRAEKSGNPKTMAKLEQLRNELKQLDLPARKRGRPRKSQPSVREPTKERRKIQTLLRKQALERAPTVRLSHYNSRPRATTKLSENLKYAMIVRPRSKTSQQERAEALRYALIPRPPSRLKKSSGAKKKIPSVDYKERHARCEQDLLTVETDLAKMQEQLEATQAAQTEYLASVEKEIKAILKHSTALSKRLKSSV